MSLKESFDLVITVIHCSNEFNFKHQ